jgi:O-antigen/teichoic acid export membrane protein
MQEKSSYRQIIKATSLFGGVQIFSIIISIIRSKFVALFLGPNGMGILGLFMSSISLVSNLTNFGLQTSAVRDIADTMGSKNLKKVAERILILKRLVWLTGLLGSTLTILFSSYLSQFTFGNKDYKSAFIWLSVTLLINQLNVGQIVVFQSLRKLKLYAKSSVFGSFFSLLIIIPIYYYFGERGIVPVIITTSVTTLIFNWFFSRKIYLEKVNVNINKTYKEGRNMMTVGFMISLSSFITVAVSYLVRIYISKSGNIDDVGLYNAGFMIIGTYVGLLFTAMGTDFYPKLSQCANNNRKSKILINHQAEITLLILTPILIIFIFFLKWIIILLYSSEFVDISTMLQWAVLGMFFKGAIWPVGFILLAKKGSFKLFLINELLSNIYILILNILGYKYFGLDGLGISFFISYIFIFIQIYFIAKSKFDFNYTRDFMKIFYFQFTLALISFISINFITKAYIYIVGVVLTIISLFYTYKELDKRIVIKEFINKLRS